MTYNGDQIHQAIRTIYGEKSHPDVPEIKVKDYEAFARVAALMFEEAQPGTKHVETAYHSLTNADISPAEFERLWSVAKPLSNRLLNRDPTVHDLTMLIGHRPNEIQSFYMDHPHPQFPEASAGDIARYATLSLYPARRLVGREPNLTELHKFVLGNYSMDDVVAHYSDDGGGSPVQSGSTQDSSPFGQGPVGQSPTEQAPTGQGPAAGQGVPGQGAPAQGAPTQGAQK